jgi:hypothetical protein
MLTCQICSKDFNSCRGLLRHQFYCSGIALSDGKNTPGYPGPQSFDAATYLQECLPTAQDFEMDDDFYEDEDTVVPNMSWQYVRLEAQQPIEGGNDYPLGHPDHESTSPLSTYKTLQETLYTNTCGMDAINAANIEDYQNLAQVPNPDALIRLKLHEFGKKTKLSRDHGNELLDLIKLFDPRKDVPNSWKTLIRQAKMETKMYKYSKKDVPWPISWKMDSWNTTLFGPVPDKVVIRVRDPVELLAYQCVDPQVQFLWQHEIRYEYSLEFNETTGSQSLGDLLTTPWAKENQDNIRLKDPTGILMPIMLYSDGVVVDKNSRQKLNSVLATCGNYGYELMKQNEAKFLLGNMPVISGVSEECVISHIIEQGYAKTKAEKMYRLFNLHIERAFWAEIVSCIKHANGRGAYMYILGRGLCTVYPIMTPPLGDEPDLKRKCGIYEGAATHACISCEYPLRAGVPYDPDIHRKRNPTHIIQQCAEAETIMQRYGPNSRMSRQDKDIIDALKEKSVHPMRNVFHEPDLLGVNSSIYDVTADPFHVFLAGICKNGTVQITSIVDRISQDNTFKSSKSVMDGNLLKFPSMPHMPHLGWTTFQNGLSHLATKKSKSEKGKGTSSAGGYRSSCFSAALMQLQFAVSHSMV